MKREWKELEEFPGYAVSTYGEFVNMRTDREISTSQNQQGHAKITLYRDGRLTTRSAALLVAKTFIEQPADFFDTPIHLNGDLMDCAASNLMWRPRWYAIKYHKQFYEPEFHNDHGTYIEMESGQQFEGVRHVCETLGVYHMDVVMSAHNGMPVFPGSYYFERV